MRYVTLRRFILVLSLLFSFIQVHAQMTKSIAVLDFEDRGRSQSLFEKNAEGFSRAGGDQGKYGSHQE